ncbi:oviduct-specific glycoprotein-like [Paramacrobiotus metropolitanus]|uniref:oviduct-specific glycoprotein-like n=1 Tax=Paramacrobiotus metropolitanus TaxID=2943436 RepID=UPI00244605C8|nr:oviduct-specific glycoprotein-like [Paramacrobiotus metropolitanus]
MDNAVIVTVLTAVIWAGCASGQTIFDLLKPQPNGAQVMALLKSGAMANAPKLIAIPDNATYDCRAEQQAGYYADENYECQVFYRCERDGKTSKFLCASPTVFNQITLVCDYWYNVDCQKWVALRNFANSRLYLDTSEQLFENAPEDYELPNFGNPAFPNLPYVNRTSQPWKIKKVVTAPPHRNSRTPYVFGFTKVPPKPAVYTKAPTEPVTTTRLPTTTSYYEPSDTTEPTHTYEADTTEAPKGVTSGGDVEESTLLCTTCTSGPLLVESSTASGNGKAATTASSHVSTELLPNEVTDVATVPTPTKTPVTKLKGTKAPRPPRPAKGLNISLGAGDVVTCIYSSWAATRRPIGRMAGNDIPVDDCTHIVYTYTSIYENKIFTLQPALDDKENEGMGNIAKFAGLKEKNPNLKALIGVGGWNSGGWIFSTTFSSPEGRRVFIQSVIEFCHNNDLDGIWIDWLTPGVEVRGGATGDYENFALLLTEMRDTFDAVPSGEAKLFIGVTVAAMPGYLHNYNAEVLDKTADLVYLIAYDLAGYWNGTIMHPSPLFNEEEKASADNGVQMWIDAGIAPAKLVLGIPTFARTYKMPPNVQPNQGYAGNFSGDGIRGAVSQAPGFLYYAEVCSRLQAGGYTIVRDPFMKVPYAYSADQIIMYEDEISVRGKVDYAKKSGLAGVYMFTIDEDDPKGFCGEPFPLTRAAASAAGLDKSTVITPAKPKTAQRCVSSEKSCKDQAACIVFPSMTFANESSDLWCGAGVVCQDPISIVECPISDKIMTATKDPFISKSPIYIGKASKSATAVKCRPNLPVTTAGENVSYLCVQDGMLGKSVQEYTCPDNTKFTALYLKCVVSGNVAMPEQS